MCRGGQVGGPYPSEDSWTISLSESVAGVVPGQNQITELFNFDVYILQGTVAIWSFNCFVNDLYLHSIICSRAPPQIIIIMAQ